MKKLIIKIGNETHELPYNGETFSFEVEEKYVPKVGDCVGVYFKKTGYEYFGKIRQIEPKEIRLKSAINEIFRVVLNLKLYYDYSDIFLTKITPEELKAKYAEAGYDWDYETNEAKELKWMPKTGDMVWYISDDLTIVNGFYNENFYYLLEKGLLFPTEAECQKFAYHCLKYLDKK